MLNVRCPKCGKELAAPDELIGKMAACPRCNTQFPVAVNVRASAPSMLSSAPAATASPNAASTSSLTVASVPSNLPPAMSGPVAPPPVAASDIRRSNPPGTETVAPGKKTVSSPDGDGNSHSVAKPAARSGSKSPAPREAAPARFIAASATDTRIDLGADGRLPELSLEEGPQKESQEKSERTTHPLVLAAILASSLGSIVLMWMWDTETNRAESSSRSQARQQLVDHYTNRPFEVYQQVLRKALQAHNQGKYADEQRYYRQVLNMLRDERLQKEKTLTGLTGVRKGPTPLSDEHLESLLSRLLSEE